MKILQINTTINSGSTGRITEEIGKKLLDNHHESIIAFGRGDRPSDSSKLKIGNAFDVGAHILLSRLFDRHGFGSLGATKCLIKEIEINCPDLIQIHNIHGYFINIGLLFQFLKKTLVPVVWTLHDCWPFTGHCTFFDSKNCFKWQTKCFECPNKHAYPKSWIFDNSRNNFKQKKSLFTNLPNLTIVVPSKWLGSHVGNSYLNEYPHKVIYNGIDLSIFRNVCDKQIRKRYGIGDRKIILGVASTWDSRKGLADFIKLSDATDNNTVVVLVGLNTKQINKLQSNIIGITRTENIQELAELYSAADVFINPTLVDNFPTTNIEALACGTPVITYNTGGSPEAIDSNTGKVVNKGDIRGLMAATKVILKNGKAVYAKPCRNRAELMFDGQERYMDYLRLYLKMIGN